MHSFLKFCLVTQFSAEEALYKNFILQAIKGGITSVQLRAKYLEREALYVFAVTLKSWLDPFHVPLIINDHVEIAKAIDCSGVHLGQSDGSPQVARAELGPNKIIGLSVETWADLEKANTLDCIDYIAASALFPTKNKKNCKTYWGIEGLQNIVKRSKHPVIAIGGIHLGNVQAVMQAGAKGVAVIGYLHDHADPCGAASELIKAIQ